MSDLAHALRGSRAVVNEGFLHLDRDAARAKMSAFTLPAPYYWVLQIVRLAVLSGATRVELDVSARSVEIRFDAVLAPALLDDIWNVALDPRVTRERQAIRFLALGLAAARAIGPKELVVRSGAVELVSNPDSEVTRPIEPPIDGTHVRCLEKFRLSHVTDFLTELFEQPAELVVLNELATFAPLQLVANGATISSQPLKTVASDLGEIYMHAVERDSVTVYASVGGVRVYRYGMAQRGYAGFGGWALVLESEALPLDLSTMSLGLHGDVNGVSISAQCFGALWRYFLDDISRVTSLIALSRRSLFEKVLRWGNAPNARALARAMLDVPMFPACGTGALISLNDTVRDQTVRYAKENLAVQEGAPPVAWINDTELTVNLMWSDITSENVTAELRAVQAREANVARWRAQPESELQGVIVREPVAEGAEPLVGSVSLAPLGRGAVRFCKERRIVHEVPFSVSLVVQVDGPLTFNAEFDEVAHTERSRSFIESLIRAVPQAFEGVDRARATALIGRIAWSSLDDEIRNAAKISRVSMVDGRDWLERLGALADVPLVETTLGLKSTREILTAEPLPMIAAEGSGIGSPTDLILKPDGPLVPAMVKMRPLIELAAERWLARQHEHRFNTQPLYEVPSNLSLQFQHEASRGGAKFLLAYDSPGEPTLSEVTLVYKGRFLAKHLWQARYHRWRAVVWCDDVTPEVEYRDVARDDALERLQAIFLEVERDAADKLKQWEAVNGPIGVQEMAVQEMAVQEMAVQEEDDAWRAGAEAVESRGGITIGSGLSVEIRGAVTITGDVRFVSSFGAGNLVFEETSPPSPPKPAFEPLTAPPGHQLPRAQRPAPPPTELHNVFELLNTARDARHELIGDFMLNRLSLQPGSDPWTVRPDGASIGADHPLAAYRSSDDPIETAFLASGAATAINAYYRDFSDTAELQLQASLLRAPYDMEDRDAW